MIVGHDHVPVRGGSADQALAGGIDGGRVGGGRDGPRCLVVELGTQAQVATTLHNEERTDNWRIVALGPGGALRTTVDPRSKGFTRCADAGESGENIQNCKGTLVGRNTVFLGGTNQAGAYDLGTGKLAWGVKSEDSTLNPLQAESGSSALVYEAATPSRPGRIIRFGPGGVDTDEQVLRIRNRPRPRSRECSPGTWPTRTAGSSSRRRT
ncbi:hypothetical protein [Streptomyces atroolivaceus]|uniref:hypothetical protein n=1 Tax=Streptomyces atroolivaceus TaxID=66869 RepID=UPI00202498BA|nr:hypothetical protein [Streptomyces atroolivaceus]